MSDAGDIDEQGAGDPVTNPVLAGFRQAAAAPGASPAMQEFVDRATTRLNHVDQMERLAAANEAAGAQFAGNLDSLRRDAIQYVQSPPSLLRAHAALDVAADTIGSLVDAHPDATEEHHDAILADLQGQIAHAAVSAMAERHDGAARAMLDDPRIGSVLSDDAKGSLNSYIDLQAMARGADEAGQRQQLAAQQAQQSTAAALGHVAGLYDPQTDGVRFPPGWAQSLMANPRIGPADKNALMHLYGRMQTAGDADASDPIVVSGLLSRIAGGQPPNANEIINHAGSSLRLADALHLAQGALPLSPDDQRRFSDLNGAVQQARQYLAGPDGENGAAGHAAWGRFVNWLLPTARQGAPLDAAVEGGALAALPRFLPTGNDIAPPPREGRPSLKEIFGR